VRCIPRAGGLGLFLDISPGVRLPALWSGFKCAGNDCRLRRILQVPGGVQIVKATALPFHADMSIDQAMVRGVSLP
jgi:hypothetical protein